MSKVRPKTTADRVFELFRRGMAPSEIDGVLGLADDESRKAIAKRWAEDKYNSRRRDDDDQDVW